MNPMVAITLVLAVLGASMALIGLAPLAGEARRKLLHAEMGLVTLAFPWLFASAWPVIVLGSLALGWFGVVNFSSTLRARFGSALGDRGNRGALWFICGVALSFVVSGGDARTYCLAILVLTLADAAAALVGRHFGRTRKSIEGSVAFFAVAFLISAASLQALVAGLVVALVATLIEAAFGDGLDNLFVPLGVLAALQML